MVEWPSEIVGVAVRFVVTVWLPFFETVIWLPGPIAVMVVPAGMPVPVMPWPTMSPVVLATLMTLLPSTTLLEFTGTPCRFTVAEVTALKLAAACVCVAGAEIVMAGLAVRLVVIVWVPLLEIVIWFPGPMAVMVVPVGMPVPVITCPTMRPAVLARPTVLLLVSTEAEFKVLLGTMEVIVAPTGIPAPLINCPTNKPVAFVSGSTSLPAFTATLVMFVLV